MLAAQDAAARCKELGITALHIKVVPKYFVFCSFVFILGVNPLYLRCELLVAIKQQLQAPVPSQLCVPSLERA